MTALDTPSGGTAGGATGLDAEFAALAAGTKEAVIEGDLIRQVGGAPIAMDEPVKWPEVPGVPDEAVIVTFCVDGDRTVTAQDGAEPYVSAWQPLVAGVADAVLGELVRSGVQVVEPVYVTASITAVELLGGDPHLDDDQFDPHAGVGVAAILGQHCGPRFARGFVANTGRLDSAYRGQPMPVVIDPSLGADAQHCDADRIAAFIQFGQLHAGPAADQMPDGVRFRQLVVLRAMTVASQP